MFYHGYVAGYTKQASTVEELQAWLEGIRASVVGETLKVWRVVNSVAETKTCIEGLVTNGK